MVRPARRGVAPPANPSCYRLDVTVRGRPWSELCRALELASHTAAATLPSFVSTSVTLLVSGEGYCVPSSGAWSASSCVVWASALAVPPVVVASLIPSIVTTFVLVTNVEDMANAEVARKVVHTQYLTQAFQALPM